jgi:hypothetical protein
MQTANALLPGAGKKTLTGYDRFVSLASLIKLAIFTPGGRQLIARHTPWHHPKHDFRPSFIKDPYELV